MSDFSITKWNRDRYLEEIDDELFLSPNDSNKIYDLLKENLGTNFTKKFPKKDQFNKIIKNLRESQDKLTISDLTFGDTIEKGDRLPIPNSDTLLHINTPEDLDRWKKGKFGDIEVFISQPTPFKSRSITIPEFEIRRNEFIKGKQDWLNK